MVNRLADCTSPYLLQHAHNPIDWWPWCDDAFAEARRRDVPVMISVGYSACHWCHVMAHESFEDPTVAALVNTHFVAIKVDREERPDVDAVYMRATQALTGQGGWPMTVFATPDGDPFFAGTYFPPAPRSGQPSFTQVVEALGQAWSGRRDEVLASASEIVGQLASINRLPEADAAPRVWDLMDAVSADFDLLHGGFGGAPKFPTPLLVDALLVKGEPGLLDLAQRTLEAMARGGIHDQVGGGFHRYAVDGGWVVPHFEKMLYDNALLLGAYARGWRRTPQHDGALRDLFERAARGIVAWLEREMLLPGGGFAASLDADSSDIRGMAHEGIYYVWSPELLADALGESDAEWAARTFHVTSAGTFEHGLSTLQLRGAPDADRLAAVSARLLDVRRTRFAPPRDDKVVASWNGWMIDSLLSAAMIFGEPSWLDLARGGAEHLWASHISDAGLTRTTLAPQGERAVGGPHEEDAPHAVAGSAEVVAPAGSAESVVPVGFAEDYGAVALAFARLAGVLGESVWLTRSVALLDAAVDRFGADDGGFYDAPDGELFTRPRDVTDNPTPSGTTALVAALRVAGQLADRPDFLARADAAARTTWGTIAAMPRFAPAALADLLAADEARSGLRPAVAVVLDADGDPLNEAARAVWRMAPVGTVVVSGRPGTEGFAHHFDERALRERLRETAPPLLTRASVGSGGRVDAVAEGAPDADARVHRTDSTGRAATPAPAVDDEYADHEVVPTRQTVYVCRGEVCFAPASTVQEIRAALWSRA